MKEVSQVFKLTCPASPAYYQREPVATVLASSLDTWRLLKLAHAAEAKIFGALPTSEV